MENEVVKVYVNCSCGGGADVLIQPGESVGVGECACGKPLTWDTAPPALGVAVSDGLKVIAKFGG